MRRACYLAVLALLAAGCGGKGRIVELSYGKDAAQVWVFRATDRKPQALVLFFHGLGDQLETAPSFPMLFGRLERVAADEALAQGFDFNVPVAVRAVGVMVLSMALLDPWLFGDDQPRPSDEEIVTEMTELMLHGLSHRERMMSR